MRCLPSLSFLLFKLLITCITYVFISSNRIIHVRENILNLSLSTYESLGSLYVSNYRCIFTIAVTMMALLSYNVNKLT